MFRHDDVAHFSCLLLRVAMPPARLPRYVDFRPMTHYFRHAAIMLFMPYLHAAAATLFLLFTLPLTRCLPAYDAAAKCHASRHAIATLLRRCYVIILRAMMMRAICCCRCRRCAPAHSVTPRYALRLRHTRYDICYYDTYAARY